MAQVTIGDISTTQGNANTFDVTHVVAAGETLIVGVILGSAEPDQEVLSVTWDQGVLDESLTQFVAFSPAHGELRIEVWRLVNPTAKTATVRVVIEGGETNQAGVIAVSADNVDPNTPLANSATQGGSDPNGSVTVTQKDEDLAFVFAGHAGTSAFAPGGGETEHADIAIAGAYRGWAASEDGSGSTVLSWTTVDDDSRSTLGFVIVAEVTITPDPADAIVDTVDPTVVNNVTVTPDEADAIVDTVDPTVVNNVTVTPAQADAIVDTVDPTVVNNVTVTPAQADAIADTVDPIVIKGSITITPDEADAIVDTVDPTVVNNVTVTPAQADAIVDTIIGAIIIDQPDGIIIPDPEVPVLPHFSTALYEQYQIDPANAGIKDVGGFVKKVHIFTPGATEAKVSKQIKRRTIFVPGAKQVKIFVPGAKKAKVFNPGAKKETQRE